MFLTGCWKHSMSGWRLDEDPLSSIPKISIQFSSVYFSFNLYVLTSILKHMNTFKDKICSIYMKTVVHGAGKKGIGVKYVDRRKPWKQKRDL